LGHLLDYYLRTVRKRPEGLIDELEARSLRDAIEGAALRILSVESNVVDAPDPQGDTRDAVTALVDRMLAMTASIPERVTRRLEAAFSECLGRAT
jgi:hypothetical protein